MLLLNKIPVLDKGFVARFDSSGNSTKLNEVAVEYFKQLNGKFLADISSLTVIMKCPLFVQLNLATFGFKVTTLPNRGSDQVEVYLPNVGEIGAPNLQTGQDIASAFAETSAALLHNPKCFQMDGCDRFISQILTPINTYTTILVFGMYNDWCKFVSQNNAPSCIAAYMNAVNDILKAEWQ